MRYAIYFTPAKEDALTLAGASWLGRDAFTGAEVANAPSRKELVATPARYGFHATIKAPFVLAHGQTEDELCAAFKAYAAKTAPIALPALTVGDTGNSFVLALKETSAPLQAQAADIVRAFDPFRAQLSADDIARRKPDQLTPSQRQNLDDWGYPHVMDDFRFHITLTGPVQLPQRDAVEKQIIEHFALFLDQPLLFSGLGLFVEPARGENFHVLDWQALKA